MPEEKKEESVFADVPERPEGQKVEEPKEESKGEEPKGEEPKTEEAIKAENERLKSEKALLEEKLFNETRARSEARRGEKEALRKLKEKQKDPEEPEEEPEEEETVVVPPKIHAAEDDIDRVVSKKLYEKEIIGVIKKKAKYRDEAEVLKAYVDKLQAAGLSSGDAEEDVEKAQMLLDKRVGRKSNPMPSPSSAAGGYGEERPGRISKTALEMGKKLGHSKEDFEKHSGEITI